MTLNYCNCHKPFKCHLKYIDGSRAVVVWILAEVLN